MTRRIPARSRPGRVRTGEEGYALMFVVAMAAIVAIMLYVQIPSVAFEAQRDREQLLIDRGEQYSRAIQLFVHKFNRFPTSMEELENTNNIRFLRRRYNDPMTGKQDWRILHAGPGGVILDSVTSAKKTSGNPQQTFITEMNMTGSDVPEAGNVNLATRVRPSDQPGGAGSSPFPPMPGTSGSGNSNSGNDNGGLPSGYNGPVMVLPNGQIVPATSTGIPAQSGGNNPVLGAPGATGLGMLPSGVAIQQNAQNTPPLPPQLGGPPGSAANLINQILTTPRPGGQPQPGFPAGQGIGANTGATPTGTSTGSLSAPQGQVIGAGLAGVASKREQEGIKSYNSHTKYNEWEFVFDITKDPRLGRGGAAGGTGGGAGANPNQNGGGGGSTMGPNMGGATTTGAGPGR